MLNGRHTLSSSAASPNRAAYETDELIGRYASFDSLFPAEERIFQKFKRQFAGNVLDIAIGGGRTTRALLPLAASYIGLDYSEGMVQAARKAFPGADLRVMDMRDVAREFEGRRFDAILISFNSIDLISWEDRCALLRSLPALLADDGVFVFSVHDLADVGRQRGFRLRPDLQQSWRTAYKPRSLARLLLRAPPWLLKAWRNRRRLRHLEKTFDGYAYVNDTDGNYGMVHVYVEVSKQIEVLKACGFSRIEVSQPWLLNEVAYFTYFDCQL
jgi:SAM-dependent methyltransferase